MSGVSRSRLLLRMQKLDWGGFWRASSVARQRRSPLGVPVIRACCFLKLREIRPIHAKGMPVMPTEAEEFDEWLTAPVERALRLQKSLPGERFKIVAIGLRRRSHRTCDTAQLAKSSR